MPPSEPRDEPTDRASESEGAASSELGQPARRRAGIAAAILLAAGVAGMFFSAPFWWLACGALAVSVVLASAVLRPRLEALGNALSRPRNVGPFRFRPDERLWGFLCFAVIVTVATVMLGDAALGDPPMSRDHTAQIVNVRQTGILLASGRLHGWSHHWFGGYPVNYHYPVGVGLWVYAVKALSLGSFSLSEAYGVAFWLFWMLRGYAVFRLGHKFFGRWVGLLAAVAYMTDAGSFRGGGWSFAVYWGVWPQSLAIAMMALAVSYVPDMLRDRGWRHVAAFGFWSGFALLTHPTTLVLIVIIIPLALAALWRTSPGSPIALPAWRCCVGVAIGMVIGSAWFGPFFATSSFAASYGDAGATAYDLGAGFLSGGGIRALWQYVEVLAVLGLVAGLISQRLGPVLNSVAILCLLCVFSQTFVEEFHLATLVSLFDSMQFERFIILAKPFLFVAAASIPVLALRAARPRLPKQTSLVPRIVLAGIAAWILSPLALGFAGEFKDGQVDREVETASARENLEDREALVKWIKENLPRDHFYRIALRLKKHDHQFLDLGNELDIPVYQSGFSPSSAFKHNSTDQGPASLRAHNVRYLISLKDVEGREFTLLERFGDIRLYEYEDWAPDVFEVISGQGEVELTHFGAERIDLVAAPGAQGRLRLNVTNFPRWVATLDGEEIPIESVELPDNDKTAFISVELKPGRYSFRYQLGLPEQLPRVLLPLALLFAIALAMSDLGWRRLRKLPVALDRVGERLQGFATRHRRSAGLALAGVAIACLVTAMVAASRDVPIEPPEDGLDQVDEVVFDFLEELPTAKVLLRKGKNNKEKERCTKRFDRFVCWEDNTWGHVARRSMSIEEFTPVRCISAHPPEEGKLVITYRDVPLGDGIVGYFGLPKRASVSARSPLRFKVFLDGREVFSKRVTKNLEQYWFSIPASGRGDVSFHVSAPKWEKKHFCFFAQAVTGSVTPPPPDADADADAKAPAETDEEAASDGEDQKEDDDEPGDPEEPAPPEEDGPDRDEEQPEGDDGKRSEDANTPPEADQPKSGK